MTLESRQLGLDQLLLRKAGGKERGAFLLLWPLASRRDWRISRTAPWHIIPEFCVLVCCTDSVKD